MTDAARSVNLKLLKQFLRDGRNLDACNKFGESIVHIMCRRGSLEGLSFLVEKANVSLMVRDDFGRNPLHDAMNHAWFEEIDLILVRKKRWPAPWKPTLTGDEQTECLIEMDTLSNIPLPLLNDSSHSVHASFTMIDDFEPDSSPAQGEGSQSTINNNDDLQSSFVDDCSSDKDSKTKKSTKTKNPHVAEYETLIIHKNTKHKKGD